MQIPAYLWCGASTLVHDHRTFSAHRHHRFPPIACFHHQHTELNKIDWIAFIFIHYTTPTSANSVLVKRHLFDSKVQAQKGFRVAEKNLKLVDCLKTGNLLLCIWHYVVLICSYRAVDCCSFQFRMPFPIRTVEWMLLSADVNRVANLTSSGLLRFMYGPCRLK